MQGGSVCLNISKNKYRMQSNTLPPWPLRISMNIIYIWTVPVKMHFWQCLRMPLVWNRWILKRSWCCLTFDVTSVIYFAHSRISEGRQEMTFCGGHTFSEGWSFFKKAIHLWQIDHQTEFCEVPCVRELQMNYTCIGLTAANYFI